MGDGSIIGGLGLGIEIASRQLAHAPMIMQTFAAPAVPLARFIGAVAQFDILIEPFAAHGTPSHKEHGLYNP
jgi:hypothetical protein